MTRNVAHLLKGGAMPMALLLSLSLALGTGALRPVALADDGDIDEMQLTALELQGEIEARQADYAAARDEADAAAAAIEENQQRIDELEREIPAQQERSGAAARELYKFQQQGAGIVSLLLSADSFYDFLAELEYMNRIADANVSEMMRLAQMKQEVVDAQNEMKDIRREADARAEDARVAMEAAQEAQAEVQRRIEEEARQQAEIAAMAAALAEEPRDNDTGTAAAPSGAANDSGNVDGSTDAGKASDPESAGESAGEAAGTADAAVEEEPDDLGGVSTSDDSVEGWAQRIDAYLAGSPLAGQGATFARAAIEYGVDPRLSPAISFTESSKGLYCFKPHNAWGWGSSSWSSWEEAIYAHVGGLARGYGGQLTIEGAKKYCPPNWQTWYNRTLAQMNMI